MVENTKLLRLNQARTLDEFSIGNYFPLKYTLFTILNGNLYWPEYGKFVKLLTYYKT